MPLILRSQKGSALTHAEMDFNFVYCSLAPIFQSIEGSYGWVPVLSDSIANDLISGITPQVSLSSESVTAFPDGTMLGYIESDSQLDVQNYVISSALLGVPYTVFGVRDGNFVVDPSWDATEFALVDTHYKATVTIYGKYDYFIFIFRHLDSTDFTITKASVPD